MHPRSQSLHTLLTRIQTNRTSVRSPKPSPSREAPHSEDFPELTIQTMDISIEELNNLSLSEPPAQTFGDMLKKSLQLRLR